MVWIDSVIPFHNDLPPNFHSQWLMTSTQWAT